MITHMSRIYTGNADDVVRRHSAHQLHIVELCRKKRYYLSRDYKCTSFQESHATADDDNVGNCVVVVHVVDELASVDDS